MIRMTDRQLDIALRLAVNDCFREDVAAMQAAEATDYPVSDAARKRFSRAFRKRKQSPAAGGVPRLLKTAAIVILIIGTVLFSAMIGMQPVRAAMWNMIVHTYGPYLGIQFQREAGMPETIEETVLPRGLSDDWRVEERISLPTAKDHMISGPAGELYFFGQNTVGSDDVWIKNDMLSVESVHITKNVEGKLYLYEDKALLVWCDRYMFVLWGDADARDRIIGLAQDMIEP